eukprot:g16323.t1
MQTELETCFLPVKLDFLYTFHPYEWQSSGVKFSGLCVIRAVAAAVRWVLFRATAPLVQPQRICQQSLNLGGGCSERSQAYLAKTCDINDPDASTIEVLGEMTSSSLLIPDSSSEAGNGTEVFSVHLRTDGLPAGRHYSFCIDLDGVDWALKTGDSLHQAPISESEFQKSAAYTVLRFNCSDCSDMSEGFLALDKLGRERSTRFSFDGNWTLGVSTETLQGGLRYRLCMDLDGGEKQDYLLGDTGVRVFISPVTAVTPTVVFAGNSSVTILCQRGGCDFLGHSYLAPDCHVPPAPTQCSFMEDRKQGLSQH